MRRRLACLALASLLLVLPLSFADDDAGDRAEYVEKTKYPVIDELREANKAAAKAAQEATQAILDTRAEAAKKFKDAKRELRPDLGNVKAPSGPQAFEAAWHFPPTPQYLTGTCWSFSATSHFESEVKRITGQEIKLSEMWTAYWEYVLKARGYVESRGTTIFEQGSESNALHRVYAIYGTVPRADYEGVLSEDGRFNHSALHAEMKAYLNWCKANNFWNEELIVQTIRGILDRTMGAPPSTVTYEGKKYTPKEFLEKVVRVNPADFVDVMSTSSVPFWTRGKLDVPDNWWDDASYVNVPLEVYYETILAIAKAGGTMTIGGDVSEPGLYGKYDIAFVPSFDIPASLINQDARELRIDNHTTEDDHGIHLVGFLQHEGHDWFLIKDSNRSSRLGQFKGYYMYRGDYVRLKMLSFGVHKDFVGELLAKVDAKR